MPKVGWVTVDDVDIRYTESGSGPTLVFVHGAYVTGSLWDDVIARLSAGFRCVAPTWPFGAQSAPVGAPNLGVAAAGQRIVGLLEVLDLLELLDDRVGSRSTIITSQLPLAAWHEWLGEPTLADAILDRIVHGSHKIALKGESLRRRRSASGDDVEPVEPVSLGA